MQGIIRPDVTDTVAPSSRFRRLRDWVLSHRVFVAVVILPVVLTTGYLFGFASDQYESEAHFLVRSSQVSASSTATGGIGQILSLAGGMDSAQSEAMSVSDYLSSHDAVSALSASDGLAERFSLPGADPLSKLWTSKLTPERLLRYYRKMVHVQYEATTGITTLTVRSFRPSDSYELVRKLLKLGEARVNMLNQRSYRDSVAMAQRQLTEAEGALATNQSQLTRFRQSRADIDPGATGQAQIGLIRSLDERLSAAKAQLATMRGAISPTSPQLLAMEANVGALQAQVAAQSARLTGSDKAIASDIGGYEKLKLQQEFLSKRYESAAASLSLARTQAQRQQLYIVHVVEPNMPVKSLYPERWRISATVIIASLLFYSIGWLIAAGVKEHAA